MIRPRNHLTMVDLIATVTAAALTLGWITWTAPGRPGPFFIVIGPLLSILWDRWRGCRGVVGGALGGAAFAIALLIWMLTHPGPSLIASGPIQAVFSIAACTLFGALMGVLAWLVAAMMGQSVNSVRAAHRIVRPASEEAHKTEEKQPSDLARRQIAG